MHPWFKEQIARARRSLGTTARVEELTAEDWVGLKSEGWSDAEIAAAAGGAEEHARLARWAKGVRPAYRRVDSCAAEVDARSNYLYSTWGESDEDPPRPGRSVVILGSGPNRIGQGIEFDYCCVHAASAFRALGYETVMVNCNPETVSTDYDTSDRLYFEPLGAEEVLEICERERPAGVVIQFGGQTPLKLARAIEAGGFPILGTPFAAIDLAEDRERFASLCERLRLAVPRWGIARTRAEAISIADRIGYPVLVRPSYVLGGRNMRVCYGPADLPDDGGLEGATMLVDRFLESAVEIDVDALCDGEETYVAAVMQHVEEAGVHSGDSSCVLPPTSLSAEELEAVRDAVRLLAPALGVVGLLNVQLALAEGRLFVLEANPRGSRTVPFASKAIGVNLVAAACRLAAGEPLAALGLAARGRGPRGERQGCRVPLPPLPRCGPDPRAGDALDGRGDGDGGRLRDGVQQGRAGGGTAAAHRRQRIRLGPGRGQGRGGRARSRSPRSRLQPVRDRRHGAGTRRRPDCRSSASGRWGSRETARRSSIASAGATATSSSTRRRAVARARTATRSGKPRSPRGSPASPRWRGRRRPSRRSRVRARRGRCPSRSASPSSRAAGQSARRLDVDNPSGEAGRADGECASGTRRACG